MSNEEPNNESVSKESIDAFRKSIFESFLEINDPRILTASIRHELIHILFISICAVLCGANTLKEISVYAKEREQWLRTVLKLQYGVSSTVCKMFFI